MDKNSIIGFILIALILFGFTFFESGRARKRMEEQRQLDSIAMANMPVDTLAQSAGSVQEYSGNEARTEAQTQAAPNTTAAAPADTEAVPADTGKPEELGEGVTVFYLDVTDKDNVTSSYAIHTDADTVGAALALTLLRPKLEPLTEETEAA